MIGPERDPRTVESDADSDASGSTDGPAEGGD
jgi:hypothetical protein